VQGVVAIELMSGKVEAITASAVIICTGGCGRVFPFTTNANIKNGDGMALAYRAGAPLKDMEFVQYHPTGLPFTGILITEAARAEGGLLINKDGYRYLQDYNLGKPEPKPVLRSMELGPREGTDDRHAVRPRRPSRSAPPRQKDHHDQASAR
jgi:fumarate reductase flavoprotein subunit